jgi:hypothetical protein
VNKVRKTLDSLPSNGTGGSCIEICPPSDQEGHRHAEERKLNETNKEDHVTIAEIVFTMLYRYFREQNRSAARSNGLTHSSGREIIQARP